MLKKSICPSRFCLREAETLSITVSNTATSCGALCTQRIKGTAADQVLHRTLIHIRAVIHALAKVQEGCKGAFLLRRRISVCIKPGQYCF